MSPYVAVGIRRFFCTGAKLNKDILIAKVNSTRNAFDVSVNGLVALYQGRQTAYGSPDTR